MSIQSVLALYRSALQSGPFAGGDELSSDHRDDVDSIPDGGLRYQIRTDYAGESVLSNTIKNLWQVEITVARKLGAGEAERTYTEDATTGMITQQAAILARAFWLVAGVHSLDSGEERELAPAERVGRVIRFTATAKIILT